MGEDKLDAPPKPIVIGSAVMAPATSTTDSAAPRRVERSGLSVWGAMSPELLDAFEQLEITLKTRPNHFFLTLCALIFALGIPILMAISSDDVFFDDVAGICCISFALGVIMALVVAVQSTSWSTQRDRAQRSILVEAVWNRRNVRNGWGCPRSLRSSSAPFLAGMKVWASELQSLLSWRWFRPW